MSEDTKRTGFGAGAVVVKSSSDDRKSLSASDDRKASSYPVPSPFGKKVIIKITDMEPAVQNEAVDIAIAALEKHNVEKDVAKQIKKGSDKKYGPSWHCIVGKNFGSYVTHETNHFVYFYLDSKAVLLFKFGRAWW